MHSGVGRYEHSALRGGGTAGGLSIGADPCYTEADLKGAFQWDEQAVGSVSLAPGTTAFPEKALAVWRSIKA